MSSTTNAIHVAIVTHSYPRFEGDWRSNFIESLAMAYKEKGCKVTVIVPFSVDWQRNSSNSNGISLITYRYMPFSAWHTLGYGKSMKGDLKINPLHILLAPFMVVIGSLSVALLLRSEKVSFIHAHWAIPNTIISLIGRFFARSKVKILTSFPGSDVTVITKLGFLGRYLAALIGKSDYLSCNSSDLKEDLVSAGIPKNKIDYVIYGVNNSSMKFDDVSRTEIRGRYKISDDQILLLLIGRFVPKKGFSTALKAMAIININYSNVRMMLIGSGVEDTNYRKIIHEQGTENTIIFIGEVSPRELKKYYSACDIFLMPSERFPSDGLNVVVVEAMSCARPLVVSDVGGNDLVVFNNENGFLHRAGDPVDLASKLQPILNDQSLRLIMGNKSRALVDERFNWNSIADYYLDRYINLLD